MMAMRSAIGGIVALLLSSCWISVAAGDVSAVQIRNQSLVKLEINWVHPTTKKATPMGHIVPNETWGVNSFVGHEFQIVEVPDEASGACDASKEGDQTCKVNYIQVTRRFQQCESSIVSSVRSVKYLSFGYILVRSFVRSLTLNIYSRIRCSGQERLGSGRTKRRI
jgi:hypothetical protein